MAGPGNHLPASASLTGGAHTRGTSCETLQDVLVAGELAAFENAARPGRVGMRERTLLNSAQADLEGEHQMHGHLVPPGAGFPGKPRRCLRYLQTGSRLVTATTLEEAGSEENTPLGKSFGSTSSSV